MGGGPVRKIVANRVCAKWSLKFSIFNFSTRATLKPGIPKAIDQDAQLPDWMQAEVFWFRTGQRVISCSVTRQYSKINQGKHLMSPMSQTRSGSEAPGPSEV